VILIFSLAGPTAHAMSLAVRKTGRRVPHTMDLGKAGVLVEKKCYIANFNLLYGNETTFRDCIEAGRRLPCSLCISRSNATFDFPPSPLPAGCPPFPVLVIPPNPPSSSLVVARSVPALTRKEQALALPELTKFSKSVRIAQKGLSDHRYAPSSSYFSPPTIQLVVDQLMEITTEEELQTAIPLWRYHSQHGTRLLAIITMLQMQFNISREEARLLRNEKNRAAAAAKRVAAASLINLNSSNSHVTVSQSRIPVAKTNRRPPLDAITNIPAKRPRAAPAPQASARAVAQTYRPQYQTRTVPAARQETGESNNVDENGDDSAGLRRSKRLRT